MIALPLPRLLTTIQGVLITVRKDGSESFTADADIDADGSGGNEYTDAKGVIWRDRYFQAKTTLRFKGKYLNSHKVPWVVVPPAVIVGVKPTVLGCRARITHTLTGLSCECVVGDVGPLRKVGEISIEAARRIKVNPNPVNGGEDRFVILYEIFPGVPASVDGLTYDLQAYHAAA